MTESFLSQRKAPTHYGTFDGRFPGITYRVNDRWQAIALNLLNSGEHTAREVLGLIDSAEAPSIEAVSLVSCPAHELQHYYDALLSPGLSADMLQRIDAALHTYPALAEVLRSGEANALPLPIRRWCRMRGDERESYLSQLNAFLTHRGEAEIVLPKIPYYTEKDSFSAEDERRILEGTIDPERGFLLRVIGAYNELERHLVWAPAAPLPVDLQPAHVSEASALARQFMEIVSITGSPETGNQYLRQLIQDAPEYTLGLQYAMAAFDAAGLDLDMDKLHVVATWALLGDTVAETYERASSVNRFCEALLDVARNGWPCSKERPVDAFVRWDKAFKHPSTLANVADSLDRDWRYVRDVKANLGVKEAWGAIVLPYCTAGRVAELIENHIRTRQLVVDAFLSDPNEFLRFRGEWDMLEAGRLPLPPVRLVAPPNVFVEGPEQDGVFVHQVAQIGPGGFESVLSQISSGSKSFDARSACALYDCLTLTDVLFSEFNREFDPADLAMAKDLIEGVRVVNVFS